MERLKRISRDEVNDLVEEARTKKRNKEAHVRAKLEAKYPELATTTIRRNDRTYNALDYIISDLESYG